MICQFENEASNQHLQIGKSSNQYIIKSLIFKSSNQHIFKSSNHQIKKLFF